MRRKFSGSSAECGWQRVENTRNTVCRCNAGEHAPQSGVTAAARLDGGSLIDLKADRTRCTVETSSSVRSALSFDLAPRRRGPEPKMGFPRLRVVVQRVNRSHWVGIGDDFRGDSRCSAPSCRTATALGMAMVRGPNAPRAIHERGKTGGQQLAEICAYVLVLTQKILAAKRAVNFPYFQGLS